MYFVIEHQKRTDGVINATETGRQTINSALSLFHERFSKMAMNTEFPSVALSLVDENLNVLEHKIVPTMYVDPEAHTDTETE